MKKIDTIKEIIVGIILIPQKMMRLHTIKKENMIQVKKNICLYLLSLMEVNISCGDLKHMKSFKEFLTNLIEKDSPHKV